MTSAPPPPLLEGHEAIPSLALVQGCGTARRPLGHSFFSLLLLSSTLSLLLSSTGFPLLPRLTRTCYLPRSVLEAPAPNACCSFTMYTPARCSSSPICCTPTPHNLFQDAIPHSVLRRGRCARSTRDSTQGAALRAPGAPDSWAVSAPAAGASCPPLKSQPSSTLVETPARTPPGGRLSL